MNDFAKDIASQSIFAISFHFTPISWNLEQQTLLIVSASKLADGM